MAIKPFQKAAANRLKTQSTSWSYSFKCSLPRIKLWIVRIIFTSFPISPEMHKFFVLSAMEFDDNLEQKNLSINIEYPNYSYILAMFVQGNRRSCVCKNGAAPIKPPKPTMTWTYSPLKLWTCSHHSSEHVRTPALNMDAP